MEHKSIPFEIKDMSMDSRTAIIAHAVYNNIDRTGDISTKGMFKSSWERKDAIDFLFNHDTGMVGGNVLRTFEDETKAYTEVKFGNWKLGDDMIAMVEAGVMKGASFGYETEKKEFIQKEGRKIRVLKQVRHIETSLLTKTPANPLAGIVTMSKEAADSMILELKENLANMEKFCRNTNASDATILNILSTVEEYKNIITKYDTVSTPLITDGEASRNDNDTFRKNILLTQILSKHGKN